MGCGPTRAAHSLALGADPLDRMSRSASFLLENDMAGLAKNANVGRAALVYFKDDVSTERAAKALRLIADVLETTDMDPGDLVHEYDLDYGHPVWYIP